MSKKTQVMYLITAVFTVFAAGISGCGGGGGSNSNPTGIIPTEYANEPCEDTTLTVGGKFKIYDTYEVTGAVVSNATVELTVTYTIGSDSKEYKAVKTGVTGSQGVTDTLQVSLYSTTCSGSGQVHIKSSQVWVSASGYKEKTVSVPNTDWSGWQNIAIERE